MADLPPAARQLLLGFGRIGYKAISAGVKVGLAGVRELGEEVLTRIKRGEEAAERMSRGEPYTREEEEDR